MHNDLSEPGRDTLAGPDDQSAFDVVQVVVGHKFLLFMGVVLGIALGVVYYLSRPPVFESRAEVVIEKKPSNSIPIPNLPVNQDQDDYVSTEQEILQSPMLIEQAINDYKLDRLKTFEGMDPQELRIEFKLGLKVTREHKDSSNRYNNVVTVAFRGKEPDECPVIVEAIINAYKRHLQETYQDNTAKSLGLIQQARDLVKNDLAHQQAEYTKFRAGIPAALTRVRDNTGVSFEELQRLRMKRAEYRVRREEIQGRLKAIENALKDGTPREELIALISESANRSVPDGAGRVHDNSALEDKLLPALLEEKTLRQDYGQDHPQVQAATQRVEVAHRFAVHTLRQEIKDLERSEKGLSASLRAQEEESKLADRYEVEDRQRRDEVTRLQQLYDGIIKQLQEIDVAKSVVGYKATVIAQPSAPKKKSPLAYIVFPISVILGLLGSLSLACVRELTNKSFRTADEVRRRLGAEVFGQVPVFERVRAKKLLAKSPCGAALRAHHLPLSREAESFRGIRTALLARARSAGLKVIQVTSPSMGDGKTTVAANLAVALAQTGKKVLLVDADLRCPRLHTLFGLSNRVGLAAAILEEAPLAEAVRPTPVANLSLLPSESAPGCAAELLSCGGFKHVLDAVREEFDFVVIDTPALLAVSDPGVVATLADGVLLAIRPTKKARAKAERARGLLASCGTPPLGVVLNNVRRKAYGGEHYEDFARYVTRQSRSQEPARQITGVG
jgi:capsular exopolysaccharide synthesis family protein